VKTLLRHARCQLALGEASSAVGTLITARKARPEIGKVADYKSLKEKADQMQRLFREVGNARRVQSWESGAYLVTRLLDLLECRYEDTVPHLIVWDMEFQIAMQRFQSALETLNALTEKEENVELLRFKARASFLLNRPAEAVMALKKALQLKKDDPALLALLQRVQECETSKESGNQAFRRGDWTVAVGKYTAALENVGRQSVDGDGGIVRAILLSNRASAYARIGAGKLSAALDDLAESLQLHPKYWKAFRSRGKVWVMKKAYKKAVRDFKSAIAILSEEMGATAAARRELEEELHKAQIELKGSSKPSHYGKHSCLFDSTKVTETFPRHSQYVDESYRRIRLTFLQ
jgi:DnaJ family protein C protein 7